MSLGIGAAGGDETIYSPIAGRLKRAHVIGLVSAGSLLRPGPLDLRVGVATTDRLAWGCRIGHPDVLLVEHRRTRSGVSWRLDLTRALYANGVARVIGTAHRRVTGAAGLLAGPPRLSRFVDGCGALPLEHGPPRAPLRTGTCSRSSAASDRHL